MSEWHRLRDPVRTPTPLPLGRYRGIPLSRSFVRIGCSGFAVHPGEEGRDSRLPLQICGLIARRGEHFRRVILSKPIYFSAPEVELYIGLSSFYEIFNPWEMNLNIAAQHLPVLNFSETFSCSGLRRTFLSARDRLPVGNYLFIGLSFLSLLANNIS